MKVWPFANLESTRVYYANELIEKHSYFLRVKFDKYCKVFGM